MPRERILIGGESGTGKTYQCLKIAEALPQSSFFVMEVDDGSKRLLEREFSRIKNYHTQIVRSWGQEGGVRQALAGLDKLIQKKSLGPDDFVVFDGADIAWMMLKDEFTDRAIVVRDSKRSRESEWDSWDSRIAARSRGAPLFEPNDWDVCNSEFEVKFLAHLAMQVPCHIILTAGTTPVHRDSKFEDKGTIEFYEGLGTGWKFEGQKRTARMMDTLIYLFRDASSYYYLIAKDRGRSQAIIGERRVLRDLYLDWFIKYAEW